MIRKLPDALIVLLTASLLLIAATGGIDVKLGPLRVRVHDWTRPLALLVLAGAVRGTLGAKGAKGASGARGALGAYLATRGLAALLIAAGGVYAQHQVRVAGGLDSYGYVSAAHLIASGRLSEHQPLAALLPFDNPMNAAAPLGHVPGAGGDVSVPRFPLGFPVVMAVFMVLGPTGPFYVPLAMAFGVIVLAYVLGRGSAPDGAAVGPVWGLLAATLVAVDPLFAAYAIQPMSDVPAACWLLAAFWLVTEKQRVRPLMWSALGGACGGMAVLTRPALLPAVIVLVMVTAERKSFRPLLAMAMTAGAFLVLQLALNGTLYGNIGASGYGPASHMFDLSMSRLSANVLNFGKWLTYSHTVLFWLLWPGALFVLRSQAWAWKASAVAAAAAAPYFFYLVFDDWESSRFLLPSIVLVLVLFTRALAVTFPHLPHLSHLSHPSHLFLLALAFACAVASHEFLEREGIYRLRTLEDKYALVGEWFKANTPAHAVALAGLHSGTIRLYGDRATIRWDQIPERALAATLSTLAEAGYEPYLALDLPSEPPLFQERFKTQSPNVEQVARVRVVNIYKFVSAY